ncbi:MAG: non-heme iron oxygenase ferredoxin subunit [Phycisphaerae bacterium]|nr:non-heme iron oxygenase ferredoxin subunit [Phycisphaerae bacterium]
MSSTATIPLDQLSPGEIQRVMLDGQPVCVANADGEIYAVSDQCTHVLIPLSDGSLEGRQIVCPFHGAMFDLKTGKATCGPAVDPIRCYPTRIEGENVVIEQAPQAGS